MALTVLGLSLSPRHQANSHALVQEALRAVRDQGAQVEQLWLGDFKVAPCIACNFCYFTGQCKIQDDFQSLMRRFLQADRLVISAPLYFAGLPAQAKALVDRCQCYWAEKHKLAGQLRIPKAGLAAGLILVGGSDDEARYTGLRGELNAWLEALDVEIKVELVAGGLEHRNAVQQNPDLQHKAYALGVQLINA